MESAAAARAVAPPDIHFKTFDAKGIYNLLRTCYNEAMVDLPKDPCMLMSYLNTKLRDDYDSLASLCADLELEMDEILLRLKDAGLCYLERKNRVEFL